MALLRILSLSAELMMKMYIGALNGDNILRILQY